MTDSDAYYLGVREGMAKSAFFGPSIHPFTGVGVPNVPGLLRRIRAHWGKSFGAPGVKGSSTGIGAGRAYMAAAKAGR